MAASCACDQCGRPWQGIDAYLPDEQWLAINGKRDGYLCLWCIDLIAVRKGIAYKVRVTWTGENGRTLGDDDLRKRDWS